MTFRFIRTRTAAIFMIAAVASISFAQTTQPTLRIGAVAPPLKVLKWLRGQPIDKFETGRVYVIEFWATWCGPCKAVMPHLSALAKQYEGKVIFIGVDVWETEGTTVAKIEEFLASPIGQSMQYSVAADQIGRQGEMALSWLKAAGRNGIPSTFVIDQSGRIAWMGHPNDLEPILPKVLDKSWNISAERAAYEAREAEYARVNSVIAKARAQEQAGDYAGVLATLAAGGEMPEQTEAFVQRLRFHALLHTDQAKAVELAQQIRARPDNIQMQRMLGIIIAKTGAQEGAALAKQTYALGAELMHAAFAASPRFAQNPEFDEARAALYFGAGNVVAAVKTAENALATASSSNPPNNEFIGRLKSSLNKYGAPPKTLPTNRPH